MDKDQETRKGAVRLGKKGDFKGGGREDNRIKWKGAILEMKEYNGQRV